MQAPPRPLLMRAASDVAASLDLTPILRPSIIGLEPYDPAFKPTRVNLSANENTHALTPAARSALDEALAATPTNRYPDPLANELRDKLAAWYGVERRNVIVGNGGDELLFNLFFAFGGAGHTLVNCPPSFSVYELYAQMCEMDVVDVWRDPDDFSLDLPAVVEAARTAALTFITSPNNPTGNVVAADEVRAIAQASQGLVLVDEAYMEFAVGIPSCVELLSELPNVAVLRTFSKAFSLAGGRCGYVIAAPEVVDVLATVRQPYTVNVFTQAAACAFVDARAEFAPAIEEIVAERERLATALAALDLSASGGPALTVWPSAANFLLVRVTNAHVVRERLRDEYSILVRDFSSAPGLRDCLRITVGTPEENESVVAAFAALLAGMAGAR